jgi:hypothetical protein
MVCVAAAQELQAAEKDAADTSTERPVDQGAVSLNSNEVLILHTQVKIIKESQPTTSTSYCFSMRVGHTPVGARHARVCEVEESNPTPVEQI